MAARQLFVLGVHRSGTSILTETAVRIGLYGGEPGDFDAGDQWNQNGYWEHRGVRALDEEILASADADWFCASALDPEDVPADRRNSFVSQAVTIIAALDAHAPWVVKDPRLCVLMAFWRPLLSSPAFLFSLRGPLSVARSLRARDGFPLAVGIALWEVQLLAALAATEGLPRAAFWYEDLVAAPEREAARLASWLRAETGVSMDATRITPPSDVRLRHHLTDHHEETRRLPRGARRLLDALRSGEAFENGFDVTPSEEARELVDFVARGARTRQFLDHGWREQRAAHEEAVRGLEGMIRLKDEYVADLRRRPEHEEAVRALEEMIHVKDEYIADLRRQPSHEEALRTLEEMIRLKDEYIADLRRQQPSHEEALRTLEEMIRLKDEYIADLRRQLDRSAAVSPSADQAPPRTDET